MMQPFDHELDKIINEAGEHHSVAGAKPDWDKMQALLDIHMPVKKEPNRRIFILLALVLLMLGGAAYFLLNKNNKGTIAENKVLPDLKPSSQSTAAITPKVATENKTQTGLKPSQQNIAPITARPTTENKTKPGLKSSRQSAAPITANTLTKKETPLVTVQTPWHLVQHHTGVNGPAYQLNKNRFKKLTGKKKITIGANAAEEVVNNEVDKNASSKMVEDTSSNLIKVNNDNMQPASLTLAAPPTDSTIAKTKVNEVVVAKDKNLPDTSHPAIAKANKTAKAQGRHPFEIALVYAPEITTIGFNYIDKPGSNYGLLLGYQFSKNFTVQTGVIKSRKNYIAKGSDYDLGYPQTASHYLTKVDGYCQMYEIPLNIKSWVYRGNKMNIFYTAGISSYIMKGEYYTLHYASTGGYYDKKMNYTSQKNYWLSLAALSMGIEKKIAPNLTIAAAPFIKIPFKGMGAGNLKLTGTGINFLLLWQPGFNKK